MVLETVSLSISMSSELVQVSSLYWEMNLMMDLRMKYFRSVSSEYLLEESSMEVISYFVTLTDADK